MPESSPTARGASVAALTILSRRNPALSLVLALTACSASKPQAAFVPPPPPQRAVPIALSAPLRATAPVEAAPIDPGAAEMLQKRFGEPPATFSTTDPPKLTTMALDTTSRSEARGLDPDGDVLFANLAEGQRATHAVDLGPGDCITVIAHGGLGVMEVDVFLLARLAQGDLPAGATPPILAQDVRNGPVALIGGQGGCFAYSGGQATHADVVVQSRRGAGPVVMRVFRARAVGAASASPRSSR